MPNHYQAEDVKRVKMLGYDFSRVIGLVKTAYDVSDDKETLLKHFIDFTKNHLHEITYES